MTSTSHQVLTFPYFKDWADCPVICYHEIAMWITYWGKLLLSNEQQAKLPLFYLHSFKTPDSNDTRASRYDFIDMILSSVSPVCLISLLFVSAFQLSVFAAVYPHFIQHKSKIFYEYLLTLGVTRLCPGRKKSCDFAFSVVAMTFCWENPKTG